MSVGKSAGDSARPGVGPIAHADAVPGQRASPLRAGLIIAAVSAAAALAWMASATLLLVFAGLLFGTFIDGLTRVLGSVLPLPRPLRLTLVSLLLAALVCAFMMLGSTRIVAQARALGQTVQSQSGTVQSWLNERGIEIELLQSMQPNTPPQLAKSDEIGRDKGGLSGLAADAFKNPNSLLSDAQSLLGPAATIVFGLFTALGNVMVIAFLGLAIAADPAAYRDGVLHFITPRWRGRCAQVLGEAGETLRHWIFGQLTTMTVIFLCTWLGLSLLGVGGALILGLQAGLLSFVPTIGPLVAGLVLVLASLSSGWQVMLGAIGLYLAVQSLESYVLTPLIQQRAIAMPPATIFAGQILLGVLFGLWGIALALPLMAVGKVMLDRLYVEDVLNARS